MKKKTVLSVDIGTTALKAALSAEDAEKGIVVCAEARVPFSFSNKSCAAREWLPALKAAVLKMRESIDARTDEDDPFFHLAGICISGNGPTLVAKDGTTLLWNEALSVSVPENCKSLFIPRLLEFRSRFAGTWATSDTIFSGPEYLIFRLTNRAVTILPEFRYIGAYWDTRALYDAGFSALEHSKLPAFRSPGDCAGVISADAAIALDGMLPAGLPVFCGAPDFIVALIGTATLSAGRLCDCAGSSEGINLCTKIPLRGEGIRTLPSVIAPLWNAAVLIPKSGIQMDEYKAKVEEKAGYSLSWNDFFERIFCDTSGAFSDGMAILRSQAEAVREAVKTLGDAAESAGLPATHKMQVTGGQALNPRWMQLKSDVSGIELETASLPDAELTGDAVLARFGLGEYETIEDAAEALVRPATVYTPQR